MRQLNSFPSLCFKLLPYCYPTYKAIKFLLIEISHYSSTQSLSRSRENASFVSLTISAT